jgi:hypothetical protein
MAANEVPGTATRLGRAGGDRTSGDVVDIGTRRALRSIDTWAAGAPELYLLAAWAVAANSQKLWTAARRLTELPAALHAAIITNAGANVEDRNDADAVAAELLRIIDRLDGDDRTVAQLTRLAELEQARGGVDQ